MTIALITAGSHGDVRPFAALARGLQSAGHRVILAAPTDAESFVVGQGVPYASLGVDFQALAASPEVRGAAAGNPGATWRVYRDARERMGILLERAFELARDADAVVHHPKTFVGPHVTEARGVPAFVAVPAPVVAPTRAFPAPLAGFPGLGPLNRFTYLAARVAALPFRDTLNRLRARMLGLPPRKRFSDPFAVDARPLPVLYGFSEALVPRAPDWDDHVHVTGFWTLDESAPDYRPPAALTRFLADGAPPVYVGFGSLAGPHPERTTRVVLEAVREAGVRAVLATGWGGLRPGDADTGVHVTRSAPHGWLFPRCAAVVHHGGAGTTAAGLSAGRPTVVCPFFGDQSFWGERVNAAGCGPRPVPQKRLTAAGLAAAIRAAVTDPGMAARAAALGEVLRSEDGVAVAVGIIERALSPGRAAR